MSSSVAQLTLTGTLAGLALGQLIVGPLSDSLGRRRPLMAGIVLHMLASVLCLFAPNIAVLGVARTLQGVGAAAAMVVAIAIVGDLFTDSAAARRSWSACHTSTGARRSPPSWCPGRARRSTRPS